MPKPGCVNSECSGHSEELVQSALQQYSQMSRVDAQPAITPDVRVLCAQALPRRRSFEEALADPHWRLIAWVASGTALVLVRNFPFGVFRTAQQVTQATKLPCAVLPEIQGAEERASLSTGEYVLNWPYSRFSQTLRSIWATINTAQRESGFKVICVVSSTPEKAKRPSSISQPTSP